MSHHNPAMEKEIDEGLASWSAAELQATPPTPQVYVTDEQEIKQLLAKMLAVMHAVHTKKPTRTELDDQIRAFLSGKRKIHIGSKDYSLEDLCDLALADEDESR